MKIAFTKMQGAGNDFVVIDRVTQAADLDASAIRRLADRRLGIGCDQVLLVEPPDDPEADFRYRIFNADGSESGQCGNGARCFARFVRERQLTHKRRLLVQVADGTMVLEIAADGRVSAALGAPRFAPQDVPFDAPREALEYPLAVAGRELVIGAVSLGNPHAVTLVDSCADAPVAQLGPAIEAHPAFPERVNAGFMEVVDATNVRLRVYERGAGETPACGSGACAAVVHGIRKGLLDNAVTVHLPGGKLTVAWEGGDAPVWLGGPTTTVFEGSIRIPGQKSRHSRQRSS